MRKSTTTTRLTTTRSRLTTATKRRSQKRSTPTRAGGVKLVLLVALVLGTFTTELLAAGLDTRTAGIFGYGLPFSNLGAGILTLLLMSFAAAKTMAATYYVRTTGNDSNSGTSAGSAWATFDHAADNTSAGDIVYFGAGTYNEKVEPSVDGSSGNPIQFIADTDGSQTGDAGDVILRGYDTKDSKYTEAIKLDKDDYLEFIGIKFTASGKDVVKIKDSVGIKLTNCEVYDSNIGIKLEEKSEVTLINCLIRDNAKSGINHKAKDDYIITVTNCTIVNNAEEGILQEDGDLVLTNTIISGSGKEGIEDAGKSFIHTYNLFYNNASGHIKNGSASTGEIFVDPNFISASNFRLNFSSPAIDAGTSSGAPSDDFDGASRPADGGYDIGCFEKRFGLIGHWKLDETTGTTADDASGEENDGTLYGPTFATRSYSPVPDGSTAVELDGSFDYVSIPNDSSLQVTDEFTIMAWVRAHAFGASDDVDTILRKGTTNPVNYSLAIVDGKASVILDGNDGPSGNYSGDTVLDVDRWYHVAATWDGTEVKVYVNGVQDHSTTHSHSTSLGTDTRSLYIGGHDNGDAFDGVIDDVRFNDVALPADYISSVYGLMAHYKFDESSGTTADDASGNESDGTLVSSPTWQPSGGRVDGAVEFSASNSITIPDPGVGSGSFSVSTWIKSTDRTGYEKDYGAGVVRSTHGDEIGDWLISVDKNGSLCFYYWHESGNAQDAIAYTADDVIADGAWYHVVVIWDGTNQKIYVDNVEQTISGTRDTSTGWGTASEVGQSYDDVKYRFDGLVDELRIFNREIIVDEIDDLYGEGAPTGIRILKWQEKK